MKLILSIYQSLKDSYSWYNYQNPFDGEEANDTSPGGFIFSLIEHYLKCLQCWLFGHNWVTESYCSPDSASEHWACQDCNHSISHIYF